MNEVNSNSQPEDPQLRTNNQTEAINNDLHSDNLEHKSDNARSFRKSVYRHNHNNTINQDLQRFTNAEKDSGYQNFQSNYKDVKSIIAESIYDFNNLNKTMNAKYEEYAVKKRMLKTDCVNKNIQRKEKQQIILPVNKLEQDVEFEKPDPNTNRIRNLSKTKMNASKMKGFRYQNSKKSKEILIHKASCLLQNQYMWMNRQYSNLPNILKDYSVVDVNVLINKTVYNNNVNRSIVMKFQTKKNSLADSFENLTPFMTNDQSYETLNQVDMSYSNPKKKAKVNYISQNDNCTSYKSPINLKESRNRNKRQQKLLKSENTIEMYPFNLPILSSSQMERMNIITNSKLKNLVKEKYYGRYSPQEEYNCLANKSIPSKTIEAKQIDIKINRSEVARHSAAFLSNYLKSIKKEHSQESIRLNKIDAGQDYKNCLLNKSLAVEDAKIAKFDDTENQLLTKCSSPKFKESGSPAERKCIPSYMLQSQVWKSMNFKSISKEDTQMLQPNDNIDLGRTITKFMSKIEK